MQTGLTLTRPRRLRNPISLAPMIDIMMILLVFFMVTSTYLDLNMIPAVASGDDAPQTVAAPARGAGVLMIRLGADGVPTLRGQPLSPDTLTAALQNAVAETPGLRVVILPSASAPIQALVSVLDSATRLGISGVQVVRLQAP